MTTTSPDLLRNFQPLENKDSLFISFEGIEGSGKTTQIQLLKTILEEKGYLVQTFREPGGTSFGEKLREAILNSEEKISPVAEACLFASSRAQLLESRILPALQKPKSVVIVDRFLDSSLAYQGIARGLGMDEILKIHDRFPLNVTPNISFYIKIDLETSWERQQTRGDKKDYFEKEKAEFYKNLIKGYDEASQLFPDRFRIIDGKKPVKPIAQEITEIALEALS